MVDEPAAHVYHVPPTAFAAPAGPSRSRAFAHHEELTFAGGVPGRRHASVGQAIFPSITHFLRATPAAYVARAPGSILDSSWHFDSLGFYVQDDWRIRTLTLNLGLRYEFITDPTETNGHVSSVRDIRVDVNPTCADVRYCLQAPDSDKLFNNPSRRNFSPRAGFAWDVRGDGRTAVRGGAAILYDVATFGSAILGLNWPYSATTRAAGNFQLPLVFPEGPGGRSAGGVDFNVEQPHSLQTNLSVERELPWSMAATVAYTYTGGLDLYRRTRSQPDDTCRHPVADTPSAAVVFSGSPDERDAAGNIIAQRRLATVGKILRTATPSRQVQLSLKLLF